VTITGPSGCGKTYTVQCLVKGGFGVEAVSTTTRPPRENECEGVSYYFRNEEEFLAIRDDDGMYECVNFNGNWYGIEKREVNRKVANFPTFLIVEPDGVLHMQRNYHFGPVFHVQFTLRPELCLYRMTTVRGDDPVRAKERYEHDQDYFEAKSKGIEWDAVIDSENLILCSNRILDLVR